MRTEFIKFHVPGKFLLRMIIFIALINVIFLITTAIVHSSAGHQYAITHPFGGYLIDQFNLSGENNLAAWYSSSILFLVSIACIMCYWIDKKSIYKSNQKFFIYGWWILSLFFLLLSLDEMGSLHENAGKLSSLDILGDQSWESVLAIPVIAVGGFMLIFAWLQLRKNILTVLLMLLGVALMGTIPLQEHLEMKMWSAAGFAQEWKRPIKFVVLEEGAEIFASLAFCSAMIFYIKSKTGLSLDRTKINFTFSKFFAFKTSIVTGLIFSIGVLFIYFLQPYLTADEGVATNWFASSAAITAVLFFSAIEGLALNKVHVIFLLMVSIVMGTSFYTLWRWEDIQALTISVQVIMISGLLYFSYSFFKLIKAKQWRIGVVTFAILMLPPFIFTDRIESLFVFYALLLLIILYLVSVRGLLRS